MLKEIVTTGLLGLMCFSSVEAEILSWDDCIKEALGKNTEIKSSQELLYSAQHKETETKGSFLPKLKAVLNYSNTETDKSSKKITEYSSSLVLSQNIFSGFSNIASLDQASSKRELAELNLSVEKNKLTSDLKRSYATYLYAQNNLVLINDIIKRREANLKMVQMRYEGGRENKGAYLLSKGNLERPSYEKLQAENGLVLAKMNLAKILGRNEQEEFDVRGDVPLHDPPLAIDLKSYLKKTPDYKKAIINEQISKADVRVSKSNFFPQLDLTGAYSKTGPRFFPESRQVTIGAAITFPLFNGGQDYYAALGALDRKRSSSYDRDTIERGEYAQIRETHNRFVEVVQKLKVDSVFEEATQIRAKIAREKYNNGLISFEDWDLIETELIARQKSLLESKKNRITVEADWEQTTLKEVL